MALTCSAKILHFADLARPQALAFDLAARMVVSASSAADADGVKRWTKLYEDLGEELAIDRVVSA